MTRRIWESGTYRIMEHSQEAELDDLKGDCYNYEVSGYTGTREQLKQEELNFEAEIEREGVYGYELQKWNPEVGKGWQFIDSCWGFVGQYQEAPGAKYNHDIVSDFINRAKEQTISDRNSERDE